MGEVRALTVWQPWASLIAEAVKTIETRGWATKYRDLVLIHAGVRPPPIRSIDVRPYTVRGFGRTGWALEGPGLPPFRSVPKLEGCILARGAVVAVARLVDCVPIVCGEERPVYRRCIDEDGAGLALWDGTSPLPVDIEAQRPFGDFAPGRYAWLLDDIVKLPEPIPARGRQGLWIPDDELVERVLGAVPS